MSNKRTNPPAQTDISRITIDLPAASHKRLKALAAVLGKSMREIVIESIEEHLADFSMPNKKTRAEMLELVDGDLAIKALQKSVSKDIKLDAKEFYATHRLTDGAFQNPAFMITPGGVVLFGVMVPSAADAEKLLAKAKTSGDLRAAAGTFKTQDFGTVTPTSKIDRAILGKALSMAAPGFEQVEAADKKIWVLQAKSKQEPVFKEFDVLPKEVQDEIKQYAEGMGLQEALDKKLKELQATYKVVVNKEAIEKLFPELPEKPAAPVAPVAPIAPVVPAKA